MKSDINKQTKSSNFFSNTYLSSKVYTFDNQDIEISTNSPSPHSCINLSPIIEQENTNIKDTTMKLTCQKHMTALSNLFCANCLDFNICLNCISENHAEHQVIQYSSYNEMMNQTRQILLQNIEQSLKQFKRKQNDVKNRTHEIELIRNSLKVLQQETIGIITNLFKQLENKLSISLDKQQQNFNQDVQYFFKEFNKINDELKDSVIGLLDCNINISIFNKNTIIKQLPKQPNFIAHKNMLQRYKKIYKNIKNQLISVGKIIKQSYQLISEDQSKIFKTIDHTTLKKFDKYIINNKKEKEDKSNQILMKTLKLIEFENNKENLLIFMNKDKDKLKVTNKNRSQYVKNNSSKNYWINGKIL